MTVAMIDGEFNVCSRNLNLKESEGNTLWGLARKYNIEENMRKLHLDNYAIQGECVGPGVEGNHYELKNADFYVYTIYDIIAGKYVSPIIRATFCKGLGLKHVPGLGVMTLAELTIDEVLKMADGKSSKATRRYCLQADRWSRAL